MTPRDSLCECVLLEIARDARGCVWLCDLVRFSVTTRNRVGLCEIVLHRDVVCDSVCEVTEMTYR